MHRVVKGVIVAILYILFFVVVPHVLTRMIPPELLTVLATTGLNVDGIVMSFSLIGVALAALSIAKSVTQPRSVTNLGSIILSNLVWFYLVLFITGLGKPWSLGMAQQTTTSGPATISITLDFRFFVALSSVIVALQMSKAALNHLAAKRRIG